MFPSVTLNNLPNELLLIIFQDLDTSSLIAVSCLCRRINALALSQILFPRTDDLETGLCANAMRFGGPWGRLPFNCVPALRLSFSMKHPVHFFSCQFSLVECVKEMEQVTRLFKTGRVLEYVFLRFPEFPAVFRQPSTYSPTDCGAAFSSLLRHLHRVQSHTLDITCAPQVEYDDRTKFDGPAVGTLKDITISRAHFMLTDFFRDWTVSTMNLSPLTAVSLENVDISALLPSLSLSSLQKLVIRCPDLHLSDIMPFLLRHPTIRNLTLRVTCDNATLAPGSLPELKDLSSSAECLSQLLSSPGSMLHLHSVTCYGSVTPFPITPPPSNVVQMLFQNVALHGAITTLDLPLSDLNISEEWLSVTPRFEHLLTGITALYIDSSINAKEESVVKQRIIESIVLFPKVETLTLFGWPRCEEFARSIKAAYPRLQKVFSGLTDISRSII
ncbi:uncharacterized protein BT62DRAFT_932974 [Guyanagaster necrorhizus]|uniref:F-box domain-containing protein n=1 Tax=Guyanagaster necrorhizus TaxID=856835 RepID=A0A9P7VRY4_9AGAR|nr:uncharacterized protein BT62DRAFT_932974 [Guyanagaster necrorhizus MCA 3950]KAG7445809.1 hypothetical protein BT62DRAFT_932974 [Guyanagaster necrorhizus MCA 3950]